ncbi:MAG: undecaprenyldiphospho-muramoylpentapeptide beta-N-acetylglucosaminyltransferase [Actinomycetes bacterium]
MRVLIAGGGSAGHIEPALALAEALRRRDPSTEITLLGTARGLETRLVAERGFRLELIPAVPLPRSASLDLLAVPVRLGGAVRATLRVLDRVRPAVVVGFGGYVSTPAYLAARLRRVPVVVHEANAKPGLANRIGARSAAAVAVAFEGTRLPRAVHLGMPLRRSITTLDRPARRAEARAIFGLDPTAPTLLVVGGSQGARRINDAVAGAVPALRAAGIGVLHAVGRGNATPGSNATPGEADAAAGPPYVPVPYLDRMDLAYAAADLVLCRAGATTCAELSMLGLPAIYVPLPHGNGEQALNALPVIRVAGGAVVADSECTSEYVIRRVTALLGDPDRLASMGESVATLGRRDADERLADVTRVVAGFSPKADEQPVADER